MDWREGKLIYTGVTGKSGAGKTTFSDFWSTKSNVGVIHFDDLVDEVKMKYFRPFMVENNKNKPVQVRSGLKKRIYSNKITFMVLMYVRDKLTRKELERRIEEFKRQGKDIVVIDDWMLNSHKDLSNKCKKIYLVARRFTQRREGLRERDNATIEETSIGDIPFALGYAKRPTGSKVETVNNYGDLEELRMLAEEKYQEVGVFGFDEKYQVKDKSIKDKLRKISRSAEIMNSVIRNIEETRDDKN